VGSWAVTVLLAVVGFLAAVLLALCLAQPFSCFALEAIAHAQEEALTGQGTAPPSFVASLAASIRVVLVTLLVGGSVLTGLFLINFVFPPAVVVTVPLKFLVCAWLLAWDFLDYPWGLHGLGVRARLRWVGRNFWAFSAFGMAWAALVIVPGAVLLLLPMGVAGAARLVVEADRGRGRQAV
jgi:CysZ protein